MRRYWMLTSRASWCAPAPWRRRTSTVVRPPQRSTGSTRYRTPRAPDHAFRPGTEAGATRCRREGRCDATWWVGVVTRGGTRRGSSGNDGRTRARRARRTAPSRTARIRWSWSAIGWASRCCVSTPCSRSAPERVETNLVHSSILIELLGEAELVSEWTFVPGGGQKV